MKKNIAIIYRMHLTDTSYNIELSYTLETLENIQTITCYINPVTTGTISWLQLRKFEIRSSCEKGVYTTLFNEHDNVKNVDSALFIDQAYAAIMKAEKLKMAVDSMVA